eukprot:3733352-Rhodomonas_salina.2
MGDAGAKVATPPTSRIQDHAHLGSEASVQGNEVCSALVRAQHFRCCSELHQHQAALVFIRFACDDVWLSNRRCEFKRCVPAAYGSTHVQYRICTALARARATYF